MIIFSPDQWSYYEEYFKSVFQLVDAQWTPPTSEQKSLEATPTEDDVTPTEEKTTPTEDDVTPTEEKTTPTKDKELSSEATKEKTKENAVTEDRAKRKTDEV